MKRNAILSLLLVLVLVFPILSNTASGYSDVVRPIEAGNTTITWTVVEAPEAPFNWLNRSFAVLSSWFAEANSKMTYEITEIGSSDSYVTGELSIGNLTIIANNTDIAYNLVFAISNFFFPWEPGLLIPTESVESENTSAYTAAARVWGNYVNGTVTSEYESITVGWATYECIVWDYVQDPSGYGEPQRTNLAYDLATGVLVRANASLSFTTPYNLVLVLDSIQQPLVVYLPLIILAVGGLGVVAIVVIFVVRRR